MRKLFLLILFLSLLIFSSRGVLLAAPAEPPPPTITPVLYPPYPTPTDGETEDKCSKINKGSVYPPNGECYPTVTAVESEIDSYPLTCVTPPEIDYREIYVGDSTPRTVDVIITHDLKEAQLGGFGPSLSVLSSSKNMDNIAKKYLFNGLFDKPYFAPQDKPIPREAYRTYWRYLTAVEQANIKADYLKKAGASTTKVYWRYVDDKGKTHETNAKELRNELPNCLKSFPVCPTFYKSYSKLSKSTKLKYDTLMPFDFDNVRGFLVLNGKISRENISYLDAIISGGLGEMGLLPSFTPDAFITPYTPLPTTGSESSLDKQVIEKGTLTSCPMPKKASGLPAPKTYPIQPFLTQTVKVNVTATEIDSSPAFCTCSSPSCSYIPCESYTTIKSCAVNGCDWAQATTTYELKGKAQGKPIGVLNNPKVNTITDAITGKSGGVVPSFYKMMTPNFSEIPEKKLISSSGITAMSNNENAKVYGSSVIYRENNQAQDAMHLLQNCWLIPGDQQSSSKCPEPKKKSCSGDPGETPPLDVSDPACTIKNNNLNLPQPLIDAIQKAAETFEVPPSLIMGLFYGEGAFNPGQPYLDAAFVEENLKACATLPGCDPTSGMIKNIVWMDDYNWEWAQEAVLELDPERTPDACNLLDGIFAWAKLIKSARNGSPAFAGKSCFGIPLNAGGGGSSSCVWDDSSVESAIRVWEFGTAYDTTYGCATKDNSCAVGGGVAANCPTGGDTCETISNRYSAPSHNACIWDIYQENK